MFKGLDRDKDLRVFKSYTNSTKHCLKMITNYKEAHPCKDNVSIGLRESQVLFTFPAFLHVRINSSFRFLQTRCLRDDVLHLESFSAK